jgi:hypothetical protein
MSERFGIWGFEMRDAVVVWSEKPARVKRLDTNLLGSEQEAKTMAHELHTEFVVNNPDVQVEVKAVFLEEVGPVAKQHLEKLGAQAQASKALARFIAARMAPYLAKEKLELNPNLENIAEGILAESGHMMAVMQQQARKQKIAILDLGGNVGRSGRA